MILQIFTADRREGCRTDYFDGSDKHWEALFAAVHGRGYCAGEASVERAGDEKMEFCVGGREE